MAIIAREHRIAWGYTTVAELSISLSTGHLSIASIKNMAKNSAANGKGHYLRGRKETPGMMSLESARKS